ncbi:hypothetical protein Droror1_Dr00002318, partial [Drosera rotundifolia]
MLLSSSLLSPFSFIAQISPPSHFSFSPPLLNPFSNFKTLNCRSSFLRNSHSCSFAGLGFAGFGVLECVAEVETDWGFGLNGRKLWGLRARPG